MAKGGAGPGERGRGNDRKKQPKTREKHTARAESSE